MYRRLALATTLVAAVARGQQVGTYQTETHPAFTWEKCTAPGSCTSQSGLLVIDSNWRWVHTTVSGSYTNCYTWKHMECNPLPRWRNVRGQLCAWGCRLSGYNGAVASGNSLKLTFVTKGTYATNVGSRLYLMDTDTSYQQFDLLNNEFTFDVDVSNLPCGLNGALYFVSMDKDGGVARFPTNKAGAKYGVGYCDSQCPRDLKFIDGQVSF